MEMKLLRLTKPPPSKDPLLPIDRSGTLSFFPMQLLYFQSQVMEPHRDGDATARDPHQTFDARRLCTVSRPEELLLNQ